MNIVGTSQPLHDAAAKAAGRAVYTGDMQLPGMLHAALLFSEVPHGIVRAIDVAGAMAVPGVVDILHCFNTTDRAFNRYRTVKGQKVPEQDRIFHRQVRFVGDRIACVVAETPQAARQAVARLRVEVEALPHTAMVQEALAGKIHMIHPDGAVYGKMEMEVGDDGGIPPDAVETVTASFLPRISHIAMEPHACVASYDKWQQELTVWSPNQSVHGIRTVMAELFDLPYERVRVVKATMGGSFGGKQEWVLEPVAVAAALRVGKPVKLVFSRGETMASTISRGPVHATMRSRITRDGLIWSMDADVTLDTGAYLGNACDYLQAFSGKFFRCYEYPHARFTARAVCTNTPMSGAFRGWGAPEMYIIMEHNLNMAARRLGIDPLELRLKNAAEPGGIDRKNGQPLGAIRFRECLLRGGQVFGWEEKRRENEAFNRQSGRYRRGTAVGCGGHINGYFPRFLDFAGVEMRLAESGGVMVNITLHDHGCGSVTAIKMLVAEVLGISTDRVSVREGDTAHSPLDVGCFASRTTYVLGKAAVDCAGSLLLQMRQDVAAALGCDVSELDARDGCIRRAGTGECYTYGDVAMLAMTILKREVWVKHQSAPGTNPGVTAAHFAQVEVDLCTGMVKVLDYVAVHDIGRAINREICIGQIQGAVLMGMGAALSERLGVNGCSGKPVSSLKDYHIVNAPGAPAVRVELVEDGQTDGPFGAKSIGEVSHVPVAPAVIGAVNDALGSELCTLPLNPDTIVEMLRARENACEDQLYRKRQLHRA